VALSAYRGDRADDADTDAGPELHHGGLPHSDGRPPPAKTLAHQQRVRQFQGRRTERERLLLVGGGGVVRVLSPNEDVRGIDCRAAVELVERPAPGQVAHDRVVVETVAQQHLGRDHGRGITAQPRGIDAERGARSREASVRRCRGAHR